MNNLTSTKQLIAALLVFSFFPAYSWAQKPQLDGSKITINWAGVPIRQAMDELRGNYEFNFAIFPLHVDEIKVTCTVEQKTIKKLFKTCLKGSDIEFSIQNNNILLTQGEHKTIARQETIRGLVLDVNSHPIEGSAVHLLSDASIGATSDKYGQFEFTFEPEKFSFYLNASHDLYEANFTKVNLIGDEKTDLYVFTLNNAIADPPTGCQGDCESSDLSTVATTLTVENRTPLRMEIYFCKTEHSIGIIDGEQTSAFTLPVDQLTKSDKIGFIPFARRTDASARYAYAQHFCNQLPEKTENTQLFLAIEILDSSWQYRAGAPRSRGSLPTNPNLAYRYKSRIYTSTDESSNQ